MASHSARFVASSALIAEEFLADVGADEEIEKLLKKSVRSEYRRVMEEAQRRSKSAGVLPFTRAVEQRVLYSRAGSASAPSAKVIALSPSDQATERARQRFAMGLGQAGARRKLSATDPNECAIALWITVGDISALLGADLIIGPSGCGWKAVDLTHHPDGLATLFKVPHHGSDNAHYEPTWDRLVADDAVALIAPYRPGRKPLPTDADISRIAIRSGRVFQTASTKPPASPKSLRRAQASLAGVATRIWDSEGRSGHVRARRNDQDTGWRVDLTEPAFRAR